MKTPIIHALRLMAFSLSILLVSAHAQTVNLSQTLTNGTYTYYALGDSSGSAVTPFTVMFYPGSGVSSSSAYETGLSPTTTAGAPISFASGKLTHSTSSSTSFVTGWTGVTELSNPSGNGDGQFAILFNLGAVYNLSEVDITYTNASGQRWSTTADAQSVYTATSFAGSMTDFTLLGSQTFPSNQVTTNTTAAYTTSADGVDAQYVLLILTGSMSAEGNTSSVGGKLVNVSILGDASPIPEPATTAALAGLAALIPLWLRRRNRRRS